MSADRLLGTDDGGTLLQDKALKLVKEYRAYLGIEGESELKRFTDSLSLQSYVKSRYEDYELPLPTTNAERMALDIIIDHDDPRVTPVSPERFVELTKEWEDRCDAMNEAAEAKAAALEAFAQPHSEGEPPSGLEGYRAAFNAPPEPGGETPAAPEPGSPAIDIG